MQLIALIMVLELSITTGFAEGAGFSESELREVIRKSRASEPATAHLVYVKEKINAGVPAHVQKGTGLYKIMEANAYEKTRLDMIIDSNNRRIKIAGEDLRDINSLMEEYGLSQENRANISNSKIVITDPNYEMQLSPSEVTGGAAHLSVAKRPPSGDYYFYKIPYFGIMEERYLLKEVWSIEDVDDEGLVKVDIEMGSSGGSVANCTVLLDTSVGYRFRRVEWRVDGQLLSEEIADDYRKVGEMWYPFRYVWRSFDRESGEVRSERSYVFKSAEFGIELEAKDFKVDVAKGTKIMDSVVARTEYKTPKGGRMGISDVLEMGRERFK